MQNAALARLSSLVRRSNLAVVAGVVAFGWVAQVRAENLALTVASPLSAGRETRETVMASPSSTLDAQSAMLAASMLAAQIPGGVVVTVMATGSMRPTFDEKAYLVVEPAAFDSLQVGDIITYKHPKLGSLIVHRVMEKHGKSLWTKGDYNSRPDNVYVTPENYRMRVVAMIYARDGAKAVAQAGESIRAVSMMN